MCTLLLKKNLLELSVGFLLVLGWLSMFDLLRESSTIPFFLVLKHLLIDCDQCGVNTLLPLD